MDNNCIHSLQSSLSILENAFEGILVIDNVTMEIKYANTVICKMFGYLPSEFPSLSINDIHPVEHLQTIIGEFEVSAHGEIQSGDEIPCRRKNGTTFLADISSSKTVINGIACIMDDEEVVRNTIRDMLQPFGYEVVCKDSGNDVIDFFYLKID